MSEFKRNEEVRAAPPDSPTPPAGQPGTIRDDAEARHRRVSEAAYYRAQRRGFAPGREHDDWVEAEREVDRGTPTNKDPADNEFRAQSKFEQRRPLGYHRAHDRDQRAVRSPGRAAARLAASLRPA